MKLWYSRKLADRIKAISILRQETQMFNYELFNLCKEEQVDYPQFLSENFEEIKKSCEKNATEAVSADKLLMFAILSEMFELTEIQEMFLQKVADESRIFKAEDFADNPYIRNIDFSEAQYGDFKLCYEKYYKNEFSNYDVSKVVKEGVVEVPRICLFADEFEYPALCQKFEDGYRTWISVTPNEIFTMEKPIEKAHGKVLTLGLGMGYFAYMATLKENVESVTIIEKEQDVIDLFEAKILPQFENRDKIRIIKANAIDYLKTVEDGEYDYCFADIWIGAYDILPYFAVKEIGRNFHKMKIDYWIEEAFANSLMSYVWIEILSAFYRAVGIPIPELSAELIGNEIEMRKKNYVHRLLRKAEIRTIDDLDFYMKPENIIRLINKTKITF